jgi:hypothetical protein
MDPLTCVLLNPEVDVGRIFEKSMANIAMKRHDEMIVDVSLLGASKELRNQFPYISAYVCSGRLVGSRDLTRYYKSTIDVNIRQKVD